MMPNRLSSLDSEQELKIKVIYMSVYDIEDVSRLKKVWDSMDQHLSTEQMHKLLEYFFETIEPPTIPVKRVVRQGRDGESREVFLQKFADDLIEFTQNEFWEWWINGKLPATKKGMRSTMNQMKKHILEVFEGRILQKDT